MRSNGFLTGMWLYKHDFSNRHIFGLYLRDHFHVADVDDVACTRNLSSVWQKHPINKTRIVWGMNEHGLLFIVYSHFGLDFENWNRITGLYWNVNLVFALRTPCHVSCETEPGWGVTKLKMVLWLWADPGTQHNCLLLLYFTSETQRDVRRLQLEMQRGEGVTPDLGSAGGTWSHSEQLWRHKYSFFSL